MRKEINGTFFEWDDAKASMNEKKHGVSFEEAATVFSDESAYVYADSKHDDDEERFIIVGYSAELHLLIVCHCLREAETVIRIISARSADRLHVKEYLKRGGIK